MIRNSAAVPPSSLSLLLLLLISLVVVGQIPTCCAARTAILATATRRLLPASSKTNNNKKKDDDVVLAITGYRDEYDDNGANQQELLEDKPSAFVFKRFQSPTAIQNALKNIVTRRRSKKKRQQPFFKWHEGKDGRKGWVSTTKLRRGGSDWVLAQSKQVAVECTTKQVLQAYLSGDLQQKWNKKDVIQCTFHEIEEEEVPTPTPTTIASIPKPPPRRIRRTLFHFGDRSLSSSSAARRRSIGIVGGGISTSDGVGGSSNLMQKLGSRISRSFHNHKIETTATEKSQLTTKTSPVASIRKGGHQQNRRILLGKCYQQDLVLKSQRIIRSHTGIMRYSQIITIDQIGNDNYSVLVNLLEGDNDRRSVTTTKKKPFDSLRVYVNLQQNGNNVDIYAAGLMKVNRMVVPNLIVFDASGIAGGMAGKGTLWLAAYFDQRRQKQQQQKSY